VASLSQGRTAAAQCGLFTHKSVPVIFEPPCIKLVKKITERNPIGLKTKGRSKKRWRVEVINDL